MSKALALVEQNDIDAEFAMRGSLSPVMDDGRHFLPPLDRRTASSRAAASRTQASYFTSDRRTTSSSSGAHATATAAAAHSDSEEESKGRYATDGRVVVVEDDEDEGVRGAADTDTDGDNMVSEFKPVISSPPMQPISAVRQALRIKRHERLQAQAQAQGGGHTGAPALVAGHASAVGTGTAGLGSASTGPLGHGSPAFSPLVSLPASAAGDMSMSMTPLYMPTRPPQGGEGDSALPAAVGPALPLIPPLQSPTHGGGSVVASHAQTAHLMSHASSVPASVLHGLGGGMGMGSGMAGTSASVTASPGRSSVDASVKGALPLGHSQSASSTLHRSATERSLPAPNPAPKRSFSFITSALSSTGHAHGAVQGSAGRAALPTVSETGKWQEAEHAERAGDRAGSDAGGHERERERPAQRLTTATSSPQLVRQKSHASFSGVYETLSQMLGRKQAEVQARRQAEEVAEASPAPPPVPLGPGPKQTGAVKGSSQSLASQGAASAAASQTVSGETTPARRSSASSAQHAVGLSGDSRASTAPASPARPQPAAIVLATVPEEAGRGTVSGTLFFEQVSRAALASHAAELLPSAAYPPAGEGRLAMHGREQQGELDDAQNRSTDLSHSAESPGQLASSSSSSNKVGGRGVRLLGTLAGAKGRAVVAALVKEDSGISGRLQVQADGALRVFSQPVASARFASPKVNTWRRPKDTNGDGSQAHHTGQAGETGTKDWELALHDSHWDAIQPQLSGPSLSSLTSLSLVSCQLSVDHLLQGLPSLPRLTALDLSDNDLSGLGVYVLHGMPMDDVSLMQVMTWASFAPHLHSLHLRGCRLTTVPGLYTRRGEGVPLQLLDLSCNGIRSLEGIEAVAGTLTVLDISVNEVCSVQDCRSLASCRSLQSVQVDPNPLTLSKGASELRAAMKTIVPHLLSLDGQATGHSVSSPARPLATRRTGTGTGRGARIPKRTYGAAPQSPSAMGVQQDTIASGTGILYRCKVQRSLPPPDPARGSTPGSRRAYEDDLSFAAHWPRFPYAKTAKTAHPRAEADAKVAASWGPVEASRVFQSVLRDGSRSLDSPHVPAMGHTVPRSAVSALHDTEDGSAVSPVTESSSEQGSLSHVEKDSTAQSIEGRAMSPLEWADMSRTKCMTLLAALKGMAAVKPWVELAEGVAGAEVASGVQQSVGSVLSTLLSVGLLQEEEVVQVLQQGEGGGMHPSTAVPSSLLVHAAAELLESEASSLFASLSHGSGASVGAEVQSDMVRRAGEWMTARSAVVLYADILLGLAHACAEGSLQTTTQAPPTSVRSFATALERCSVAPLCAGIVRIMTSSSG